MLLLIREEKLDKGRVAAAVRATFAKRATHDAPKEVDPPPAEWEPVFGALARECRLELTLVRSFEVVHEFVGNILGKRWPKSRVSRGALNRPGAARRKQGEDFIGP